MPMAENHMVHDHMVVQSFFLMMSMCPMSLFCFCARTTTTFMMRGMIVILRIQCPIRLRGSFSDDSHTT